MLQEAPDNLPTRRASAAAALGLACFAAAAAAPALDPHRLPSQYHHRVWQGEDGPPLDSVHGILQGREGALWLATPAGPVRFDGRTFTLPPAGELQAIALLESAERQLWVGTPETGLRQLGDGGRTEPVSLDGRRVTCLYRDGAGALWIGTSTGLERLYRGQRTSFGAASGLVDGHVAALTEGVTGVLWIGTRGGLHRFSEGRLVRFEDSRHTSDGLPSEDVRGLFFDQRQDLWIATGSGLAVLRGDRITAVATPARTSPALTGVLRDGDGNLWVGAEDGLHRWYGSLGDDLRYTGGLPLAPVESLLEDTEGNLWVGTAGGGLHRFQDGKTIVFSTAEGLGDASVRTVHEDSGGGLWVGTDGGGLFRLRDGAVEPWPLPNPDHHPVMSLVRDRRGVLWVGTGGSGVFRLEGERAEALTLSNGLANNIVPAVLETRDGAMWIGTVNGLHRFEGVLGPAYTSADGLSNNEVRSLLEDRDGGLWVGTTNGLDLLRDGQIHAFDPGHGLASGYVLSLHQDSQGRLWVGTDGGLSLLEGNTDQPAEGMRFRAFTSRDGLTNEVLYQVQSDGGGELWACSNKGLFRIGIEDLETFDRSRGGRRLSSRPLAGSRSWECNGYSQPASWRGSDGRLWWSTIQGLVVVEPGRLRTNPLPPRVSVERVLVDGTEADPRLPGEPPRGARDLEIRYAAVSLTDPEHIAFRHRLTPRSQAWTETQRREVFYTNLPAGSYRFEVLAANADGVWQREPATFTFHIRPPFYRTVPFYAVAALAGLVSIRGLYRLRFRQLVRRNHQLQAKIARRTREVERRKEELATANDHLRRANRQLQPANEELTNLNREKADFIAVAAHDLRGPLVNLKGFASESRAGFERLRETAALVENHLEATENQELERALGLDAPEALDFIDASTDRMSQLISALLALSRLGRRQLLFERMDLDRLVADTLTHLRYSIEQKRVQVEVAPLGDVVADRAALRQILENLLHNAISYLDPARPGRIRVRCQSQGKDIRIQVEDNGCGIAEDQRENVFKLLGRAGHEEVPGEGMGLAFVRSLIERHGGRIWFDSEPGVGTTFSFTLPLRPPDGNAQS